MATREQLIEDFADHKYATGEKFARLINSMKVVQEPVADPAASGTSLSFIDSIEQDADGKITATKKTLDLANAHELNPFKGWWKTGDTLPTSGFDGAYLYFKDTTQSPAVTTIYQWNGTTYADTGTVVDTSNVQTFASGQAVNETGIKDFNGNNAPNAAGVLSAEAGQTIVNTTMELVESANLLNPATVTPNKVVKRTDGTITIGNNTGLTPYIPIPDEGLICNHTLKTGGSADGAGGVYKLVDGEYVFVAAIAQSVEHGYSAVVSKTNSDYQYARFNLYWGTTPDIDFSECGVYKGSTLPSSFIPYQAPYYRMKTNIPDGSVTAEKLADGVVTNELLPDTETGKIADARQINNLLDAEEVRGKNLLYYPWEEKAYGSTGGLAMGEAYHHMDVPCEPNTSYCLSTQGGSGSAGHIGSSVRYVVLLDADKNVLSVVGDTERVSMVITTTADTAYIGVSAQKVAVDLQLEVGESRTIYEEPFEPYFEYKVKGSMLPPVNIPDGSITAEKLAAGISLPASPNMFGRIYASNTELAASTLLLTDFVECFKNISIVAHINSVFTEVQVGLAYHGFYGGSFQINGTNIILVSGENDTVRATLPHGLTLGNETTFIIDKGVNAAAKITLMNDQGDLYQHDISNFGGYQGRPFLRNNGSNAIDAELSFVPKDINQKIWMFGDSYFSYSGNNRWPYYLINNGYVSNLMISRGGDNATEALNSFTTLLGTGARPSYVLWFMGMNGGTDDSSSPNATWLEKTQGMLALCSQYGITPVLATIPTIPGASHFYMNEWIRSSGYRYIDCAMAVEVSGSNYWKNWGETNAMLSSDEVHPTSYGAKALYSRVIADFPEITIED